MKKSIHVITQGLASVAITPVKLSRFVSLNFDNCKLSIDAYNDMFREAEARDKCLITLADEKTVFEFTTEDLFEMIRFYTEYSADNSRIVSYRNKSHYIVPDPPKEG